MDDGYPKSSTILYVIEEILIFCCSSVEFLKCGYKKQMKCLYFCLFKSFYPWIPLNIHCSHNQIPLTHWPLGKMAEFWWNVLTHFREQNFYNLIQTQVNFVPKVPIDNKSAWVQVYNDLAPNLCQVITATNDKMKLLSISAISKQGRFWVCAQPMRDSVTL